MQVKVKRCEFADGYTMGKMYVNGVYMCDTLEDCDRSLYDTMAVEDIARRKVKGQTAIPIGCYSVKITFSPRFKRDMPLIEGVKGFAGVRIHAGNCARDTEGCILLGTRGAAGMLRNSRQACDKFFALLQQAGGVCDLEVCYEE